MKRLLLAILAVGLSFCFLMPAVAENDGVIYGCYKDKKGKLRIVKKPGDCKKHEIAISWNMVGPAGADGAVGPKGDKGDPGTNGINGTNGTNGIDGADGTDGAVGPKGDKGDPGTNGINGTNGADGEDGDDGADSSSDLLLELCELYVLTGKDLPEICFNCGNDELEPSEECDDGNMEDDDGCSSVCMVEACGDGIINQNEECDDGNMEDDDECSSECIETVCGNGRIDTGEECDDSNTQSYDGCDAECSLEYNCGDGIVEPGEQCDDGEWNLANQACTPECRNARCGDGYVRTVSWMPSEIEECDDGNNIDGDGCRGDCVVEGCACVFTDTPEEDHGFYNKVLTLSENDCKSETTPLRAGDRIWDGKHVWEMFSDGCYPARMDWITCGFWQEKGKAQWQCW
jgi:cysteine-rich repeat protein